MITVQFIWISILIAILLLFIKDSTSFLGVHYISYFLLPLQLRLIKWSHKITLQNHRGCIFFYTYCVSSTRPMFPVVFRPTANFFILVYYFLNFVSYKILLKLSLRQPLNLLYAHWWYTYFQTQILHIACNYIILLVYFLRQMRI